MLDLKTSLEHCTFCPRLCSHTCPVSLTSAREALTPQAKMSFYAARKLGGAALRRPRGADGFTAAATADLRLHRLRGLHHSLRPQRSSRLAR